MGRLIGGPLDGKECNYKLPFVDLPYPNSLFVEPETVERYERRGGYYFHHSSRPYPNMRDKLPKESQP